MDVNDIFDKMGEGYLLLANETEALLVNNSSWHPEPRPDIPVRHDIAVKAIKGESPMHWNRIAPLDQFRWYHRVGWREWVGDRGEKYDVFALVQ